MNSHSQTHTPSATHHHNRLSHNNTNISIQPYSQQVLIKQDNSYRQRLLELQMQQKWKDQQQQLQFNSRQSEQQSSQPVSASGSITSSPQQQHSYHKAKSVYYVPGPSKGSNYMSMMKKQTDPAPRLQQSPQKERQSQDHQERNGSDRYDTVEYLQNKLQQYYKKSQQLMKNNKSDVCGIHNGKAKLQKEERDNNNNASKKRDIIILPGAKSNLIKNQHRKTQKSVEGGRKYEIQLDEEDSKENDDDQVLLLQPSENHSSSKQFHSNLNPQSQPKHQLSKIINDMHRIEQIMKQKVESKLSQLERLRHSVEFQEAERLRQYKFNQKLQQELKNCSRSSNSLGYTVGSLKTHNEQLAKCQKAKYVQAKKQLQKMKKHRHQLKQQQSILRDSLKLAFNTRKRYIKESGNSSPDQRRNVQNSVNYSDDMNYPHSFNHGEKRKDYSQKMSRCQSRNRYVIQESFHSSNNTANKNSLQQHRRLMMGNNMSSVQEQPSSSIILPLPDAATNGQYYLQQQHPNHNHQLDPNDQQQNDKILHKLLKDFKQLKKVVDKKVIASASNNTSTNHTTRKSNKHRSSSKVNTKREKMMKFIN